MKNFSIDSDTNKKREKIRNTVIPDSSSNNEINEYTDLMENGKVIWKYTFLELLIENSIPTSIQIFNLDKLIISFRDGRICVILLHILNNILYDFKPIVLFNFQSNIDYKFSVKSFHICPWYTQASDSDCSSSPSSSSSPPSSSSSSSSPIFNFEIITFNSGDILSHWRLKTKKKFVDNKDENNTNNKDNIDNDNHSNNNNEDNDNEDSNNDNNDNINNIKDNTNYDNHSNYNDNSNNGNNSNNNNDKSVCQINGLPFNFKLNNPTSSYLNEALYLGVSTVNFISQQ